MTAKVVRVAEAALEVLDAAGAEPVTGALRSWLARKHPVAKPTPQPQARSRDLFDHAIVAAEQGLCGSLTAALHVAGEAMHWTEHAPSDWALPFGDRMATGLLVGPDAPLRDDQIAFGAFVVAPGTFYPEHGHSAAELYLTLGGDPLFLGQDGWVELDPGRWSIQGPDVVHALRTRDGAALFFWVWWGDLAGPKWSLDMSGRRFSPPHLLVEPP